MRDLWLIARHEYLKMVRRKSFLLTTVGLPLVFGAIFGVTILFAENTMGRRPVGYVDHSGLLTRPGLLARAVVDDADEAPPVAYPDEAAGRAALQAGDIHTLFVVAEDYARTLRTDVYYTGSEPDSRAYGRFSSYMRSALLHDLPEQVQTRLVEGHTITYHSADGRNTMRQGDVVGILVPIFAAILFMVASMSSSGYLLQAVVSEKENRTMEVIVSSISPTSLMGGKIAGLMSVALTQLAIWGSVLVVGVALARVFWGEMPPFQVPWAMLGIVALFFLPAFGLIAGLMTALGAAVHDVRHGQAVSGPLTLPFMIPIMLFPLILHSPGSPLLIAMTLFPMTAFVTVIIRVGVSTVPLWEVVTSWVLLAGSAVLMGWAAAHIFRLGMLRYGQPLSLRQIVAGLRGSTAPADLRASDHRG